MICQVNMLTFSITIGIFINTITIRISTKHGVQGNVIAVLRSGVMSYQELFTVEMFKICQINITRKKHNNIVNYSYKVKREN